jgi:hypothetical protein
MKAHRPFTIMTNLQRSPVKHNTGFLLFSLRNGDFPGLSSRCNVNDVIHRRRTISDGAALQTLAPIDLE